MMTGKRPFGRIWNSRLLPISRLLHRIFLIHLDPGGLLSALHRHCAYKGSFWYQDRFLVGDVAFQGLLSIDIVNKGIIEFLHARNLYSAVRR